MVPLTSVACLREKRIAYADTAASTVERRSAVITDSAELNQECAAIVTNAAARCSDVITTVTFVN